MSVCCVYAAQEGTVFDILNHQPEKEITMKLEEKYEILSKCLVEALLEKQQLIVKLAKTEETKTMWYDAYCRSEKELNLLKNSAAKEGGI